MRATIESVTGHHQIYQTRREEFRTSEKVPFRVSPTPFQLSLPERNEIHSIGVDVAHYFHAVNTLYQNEGSVRELLDRGKPEIFLAERPYNYLFIRPDIIITPAGFSICEIETSPFGLALAEMLNRAYREEGHETLIGDDTLPDYVRENTPINGAIIYSNKTQQYAGQLTFLADEVFSGADRTWRARSIYEEPPDEEQNIYRGFHLSEYNQDPSVRSLLDNTLTTDTTVLPSPTPHLEEKAILAFLWDKRYEEYLRSQLGTSVFNHLRTVIPPTWIVGEEEHFAPGLPDNVSRSIDLASLSRAKRAFVLKSSGFKNGSSWSEGVHFLHEKSSANAGKLLKLAEDDKTSLHVVQSFTKATDQVLSYEDDGRIITMKGRTRLTPYFSPNAGKLVAIKATTCENTDFLHATSSSINTAVA